MPGGRVGSMRLSTEDCRQRLMAAARAFLATTGEDLRPHLVPVTFAVEDDKLVIAVDQKPKSTTDLRRLRNISWNPRVAILCDRYDDDWSQLWWVRADGAARIDQRNPAAVESLAAKYPPYRLDPPRGPIIVVNIDQWTGWSAR
jgi:PPOX class probable F420-dependent enzyme